MDVINTSTVSNEASRPPGAKIDRFGGMFYTLHVYQIDEERGEFYCYALPD